jgi:hypothetical protein
VGIGSLTNDPRTQCVSQAESEVRWYRFRFAGHRIQESSKSTSKTAAKEAEKMRRRELEHAYNGINAELGAEHLALMRDGRIDSNRRWPAATPGAVAFPLPAFSVHHALFPS